MPSKKILREQDLSERVCKIFSRPCNGTSTLIIFEARLRDVHNNHPALTHHQQPKRPQLIMVKYYHPLAGTPVCKDAVRKHTSHSRRLKRDIVTFRTSQGSVYTTQKAALRAWKRKQARERNAEQCPECGDKVTKRTKMVIDPDYDPRTYSYHSMNAKWLCRECAACAYEAGILDLSEENLYTLRRCKMI